MVNNMSNNSDELRTKTVDFGIDLGTKITGAQARGSVVPTHNEQNLLAVGQARQKRES